MTHRLLTAMAIVGLAAPMATLAQSPAPPPGVTDITIQFMASDGTPLAAKLSLPAAAVGAVPVVFHLHGAGPRNYDHVVRYRDTDGQIRAVNYYDYYARELAKRGVAFFRMSKRGCTIDAAGQSQVDRAVFSKTTATVLLDDYARGLDELRGRKEIDATRIVLSGASEGTRLAPQLALRTPAGIAGLALMSYQPDNIRRTVEWQNTVGPWRSITYLIPASADDALTKAEYEAARATNASLAQRLPFAMFDTNADGTITSAETARVLQPRLDAILKAVKDRDDDFLWTAVVNLSSGYLLDGWEAEPTSAFLLKVARPIGIFHGELDGTTRVEGVRETQAAFSTAGRKDLTVKIYPDMDHDLGWTPLSTRDAGPQPHQDAFAFIADLVRRR
jgi:pimeloyl-ACP methyl ester carboxylesterase